MIAASTIFDQPWIILVALAIGFLRWLLSQKGQARKDASQAPKSPEQSTPRSDTQSEEQRIRRFLEALGQPPGAKPPPAVARRSNPRTTVVAHVPPPIRSPLPPLTTVPPPLPIEMESRAEPPPLPRQERPRIFTPAIAIDPVFEAREPGIANEPALRSRTAAISLGGPASLVARLTTKQALRDAIVLREIFGPPRSLQPLETISGF